jgi:hypothetical protein
MGSRLPAGGTIETKVCTADSRIEYTRFPHSPGIPAVVAAESFAGENEEEYPTPVFEMMETGAKIVGRVKVVVRHGFWIVIVKTTSAGGTSGQLVSLARKVAVWTPTSTNKLV